MDEGGGGGGGGVAPPVGEGGGGGGGAVVPVADGQENRNPQGRGRDIRVRTRECRDHG
ncbi:MAG: hypothetical protein U0361_05615 [Nitrospiraceae bacterium]